MSDSLLLDSHVWVWVVGDERRISSKALKQIRAAAKHHGLAVSGISFWELALKAAKGVLDLRPDAREWLTRAAARPGIGVIDVDRDILVRSAELQWSHRDPADRILVATALYYDLRIATADDPVIDYGSANRRLRVLDVRAGRG